MIFMTWVTVALVDLLVQILLKTILYLLEITLFGSPMSANNYVFLRTLLLLLSLSLSLSCHADHHVWMFGFFEIIMFEMVWMCLNIFEALYLKQDACAPCGPSMKNDSRGFGQLNYPSITSMPTHILTLYSEKKNWTKRFYSTSTGRGLKLKDFNIPSGSFWSSTAQLFLAIFGAASRRWKEISNIPMLHSQPWQSIAFNFLQWL